ncbi:MAG: glucose-6-phosphate isomerase [Thermoleophilia bacterium]|nr:glucose-6-phosphate isomerase [Thermoleophilia bacterium]
MTEARAPLPDLPAWRALERHYRAIVRRHLRELFEADPGRGERLALAAGGLHVDYSKHRSDDETVRLLCELAGQMHVRAQAEAMFRGEPVNVTEGRPALHTALRLPREASLVVDGRDVVRDVHEVLDRMAVLAESLRTGERRGHTGRRIAAVVNIGIGGSHLGPELAHRALRRYARPDLAVRFASNVDPASLAGALQGLDPAETLFVVSSKSFTTPETLANARAARAWALAALGEEAALEPHFVAVTANAAGAARLGIGPASTFPVWDWVGGRYSLWSATGVTAMLELGPERFRELLAGAHEVDEHFRSAPLGRNAPALHGLLGVWYAGFFGAGTAAVIPYSSDLDRLPAYLQQLAMESNGKRVTLDGTTVTHDTAPVVWGEPGTNAQHSFFQLLHQGTRLVPCDLIAFSRPLDEPGEHHELLLANALAQAEALAFGRTAGELRAAGVPERLVPHQVLEGNRPSTFILGERLAPSTLGALVAFYEHSVFTQAAVWGINPFDQWGVELGKELASRLAGELAAAEEPALAHDSSTNALVRCYRASRREAAG